MNKKTALINLVFCSIMHGLNHFLLIFFKPMYIQMSNFYHLREVADITVKATIIYAGYGSSNFISGFLSRRYSRKMILFIGMLVMSLAVMFIAFIPSGSFNLTVLLIFIMGLSGGVYHPAANTFATAMYEEKKGHAIGMLSIGSAIGFVIAPFIGEYLGNKLLGFQLLFFICGIAGFIFAVLFFIFVEDDLLKTENVRPDKVSTSGRSKVKIFPFAFLLILVCIPVTLKEISNWSFYEITPFWVNFGFSRGITISLIQSMLYLPSVFIQPFVGKLCDRFGSVKVSVITFILCGVGIALFSISNIFTLWLAMIVFGAGMGSATVAGETYMADMTTVKNRSLIYGIVLSAGLGIGGTVSGISGWVVDIFGKKNITGYNLWYIFSGVSVVLSAFIFILIEKIKNKKT
ncbi:MAG: MFS transporter [Spirochaetes bacterium]|nr:MFS transporter [Spirochaetota bacterium]